MERVNVAYLFLQRDLGTAEFIEAPQNPAAMGKIGGCLAPVLVAEQSSGRGHIELGQGENGAQQQARLGEAQVDGRRRCQAGPLRGAVEADHRLGADGGRLGDGELGWLLAGPPLSDSAAVATGPRSGAPGSPAS